MNRIDIAKEAIELFLEYRDIHGYSEEASKASALLEFVEAENANIPPTQPQHADGAREMLTDAEIETEADGRKE